MGLTIDYFYSLSPREFWNVVQGYQKKQEASIKLSWEQCRLISFYSAFQMESKDKNINPEKFMPLPWDNQQLLKQPEANKPKRTRQEMKALFDKIDKKEKE